MAKLVDCWKCGGTGHLSWAAHYANGECFMCHTTGKVKAGHPKFAAIKTAFEQQDAYWHQAITVAELTTPAGIVLMDARNGKLELSVRTAGKARDERVALETLSVDAMRAMWQRARELAAERGLTFVPYVFGAVPAECRDKIAGHCIAWIAKHCGRFGLDPARAGFKRSYAGEP
jgi:hypothetical protein